MAGIGFELKKLFHRKGLVAMVRAYGYAGVMRTGPMLLGILLQFGVLAVSGWWHVPRADQNLLVCMIAYTLLASLVLTSFLSMPVTRFLADMLFEHHEETILPSFWGCDPHAGGGCGAVRGVPAVFRRDPHAGVTLPMAVPGNDASIGMR